MYAPAALRSTALAWMERHGAVTADVLDRQALREVKLQRKHCQDHRLGGARPLIVSWPDSGESGRPSPLRSGRAFWP